MLRHQLPLRQCGPEEPQGIVSFSALNQEGRGLKFAIPHRKLVLCIAITRLLRLLLYSNPDWCCTLWASTFLCRSWFAQGCKDEVPGSSSQVVESTRILKYLVFMNSLNLNHVLVKYKKIIAQLRIERGSPTLCI